MKPKHILVVDDETSFTRMLKVNLELHTQHTVVVVNRPHEALAAAHKQKPDLVLMDVIMPGQDGGELAARFQADPFLRGVPIVFLTATVSRAEAEKGLTSGGFPFLAKPVKLNELLTCLARYLGPTEPRANRAVPAATGAVALPRTTNLPTPPASGGTLGPTAPTKPSPTAPSPSAT